MTRTSRISRPAKTLIAASLVAGAAIVPLGLSATEAGALNNSPFCKALYSWDMHPAPTPTSLSISTYHLWAKTELPYFIKMEGVAPNVKTKAVLKDVVAILTTFSTSTSMFKFSIYAMKHRAAYSTDVRSLVTAIRACTAVKTIQLP